jgi:Flp pilus assembly protein CpaB
MAAPKGRRTFQVMAIVVTVSMLVVGAHRFLRFPEPIEAAKRPEDAVMVMVAGRDLHPGVMITEDDVYGLQILPRFLPEGVFWSPDFLVGRIPRERILANEFVRAERLADPRSGVGMNAIIPRGTRAITIDIDGALVGYLPLGNLIDLLRASEADPELTHFASVYVLGARSPSEPGGAPKTHLWATPGATRGFATLLVTADDAEDIAQAEHQGEVRVSTAKDCWLFDDDPLRGHLHTRLREVELRRHIARVATPKRIGPVATPEDCRVMDVIENGIKGQKFFNSNGHPCEP